MTEQTKLYAFIAKAGATGVPGFQQTTVMEASDDRLKEKIRQQARCYDASVVLVQPDKWNPPRFKSVDQQEIMGNFPQVMMRVTDHLRKAGISNIDQNKLIQEGTVMPNPMSGRIIFVYKIG
jgi:hypothetical protein